MGKYEPLYEFLKNQDRTFVSLTFEEIEQILGAELPKSKRHRAWWSNNPLNNVMTEAWLEAGYRTEQVDVDAGKLVFSRDPQAGKGQGSQKKRPSILGSMKGLITIAPGVDLTEPADPDWGKVYDD